MKNPVNTGWSYRLERVIYYILVPMVVVGGTIGLNIYYHDTTVYAWDTMDVVATYIAVPLLWLTGLLIKIVRYIVKG